MTGSLGILVNEADRNSFLTLLNSKFLSNFHVKSFIHAFTYDSELIYIRFSASSQTNSSGGDGLKGSFCKYKAVRNRQNF